MGGYSTSPKVQRLSAGTARAVAERTRDQGENGPAWETSSTACREPDECCLHPSGWRCSVQKLGSAGGLVRRRTVIASGTLAAPGIVAQLRSRTGPAARKGVAHTRRLRAGRRCGRRRTRHRLAIAAPHQPPGRGREPPRLSSAPCPASSSRRPAPDGSPSLALLSSTTLVLAPGDQELPLRSRASDLAPVTEGRATSRSPSRWRRQLGLDTLQGLSRLDPPGRPARAGASPCRPTPPSSRC